MSNNELIHFLNIILEGDPQKITISNRRTQLCKFQRVCIRKLSDTYQIESFTDKQSFHKNISRDELLNDILSELTENFRQLNALSESFLYEIKISKKGKILFNKSKNNEKVSTPSTHNRKKNYIIEEGVFVPALYELGIITKDGKIVSSMHDKFRQINRFTENIDAVISKETKEHYNIIDFGCGKSYLTFVLYYYFTEIKKVSCTITGLDLKRDVIEKCNAVAEKYGYKNLNFYCCDIKDYESQLPPDIVITLHACDTATDYALYNAVRWGAKHIFSVPCCQHELNSKIDSKGSHALSVMCSYGLIKERMCALATDALRGKILEYHGYKVDMLEFIDMDNSPKNLLIRARKTTVPNEYKRKALLSQIEGMSNEISASLTLKDLLM